MRGKRVFITGGNSGIGLVATELAKQGAEIVLACKPSKKTDLAVASKFCFIGAVIGKLI